MAKRWPHSGSVRPRNLSHRRGQPCGTLKWGSLDSSDVEATEYKTCPVQLWYYTLRAVATVYHTVRCSRTTNRGKKKKKVVVFYNGGILTKVTNVRVYLPSFIYLFFFSLSCFTFLGVPTKCTHPASSTVRVCRTKLPA